MQTKILTAVCKENVKIKIIFKTFSDLQIFNDGYII